MNSQESILANEEKAHHAYEKATGYLKEQGVELDKPDLSRLERTLRALIKTLPDIDSLDGGQITDYITGIPVIDSFRMRRMEEEDRQRRAKALERKEREKAEKEKAEKERLERESRERQAQEANASMGAESASPDKTRPGTASYTSDDGSSAPQVTKPMQGQEGGKIASSVGSGAMESPAQEGDAPSRSQKPSRRQSGHTKKPSGSSLASLMGNRSFEGASGSRQDILRVAREVRQLKLSCSNKAYPSNFYPEDLVVMKTLSQEVKKNPDAVQIPGHDLTTLKGVVHYAVSCMMDELDRTLPAGSDISQSIISGLEEEYERQRIIKEQISQLLSNSREGLLEE